jgi:hypothetical protein
MYNNIKTLYDSTDNVFTVTELVNKKIICDHKCVAKFTLHTDNIYNLCEFVGIVASDNMKSVSYILDNYTIPGNLRNNIYHMFDIGFPYEYYEGKIIVIITFINDNNEDVYGQFNMKKKHIVDVKTILSPDYNLICGCIVPNNLSTHNN